MSTPGVWASDVTISMPQATPDSQFAYPLDDTFVFTENGLFHNLTDQDISEIRQSAFRPPVPSTGQTL